MVLSAVSTWSRTAGEDHKPNRVKILLTANCFLVVKCREADERLIEALQYARSVIIPDQSEVESER